jgi:hypothetical protein
MILGEGYSIPDHIVEAIQAYDPELRIRWGEEKKLVRLERKVTRGAPMDPRWFKHWDDFNGCRDGYILVMEFAPTVENYNKVVYTLKMNDLWAFGSPNQYADELDQQYIDRETRRRQATKELMDDMFRDLWRHLNTVYTVPEGAGYKRYLGTGRGERLE